MPRCANLMVVALLMAAVSRMSGQGDDPKNSLQQRLNAQFALTKITADRSDIVTTGTLCSSSLGREVWIAVLCSAIPSPHWNSCRPRATSFGKFRKQLPARAHPTLEQLEGSVRKALNPKEAYNMVPGRDPENVYEPPSGKRFSGDCSGSATSADPRQSRR